MNLHRHFNYDPPIVEEFPIGSGIFHIPIVALKKQLSEDFVSWGTENCKTQIILRGNEIITSTSLELNLTFKSTEGEMSCYKFVGAITFKDSRYAPNEDYEGIGIAEALKNASKNIGRAYGLYLNRDIVELGNIKNEEAKKPSISKSINEIIKQKK